MSWILNSLWGLHGTFMFDMADASSGDVLDAVDGSSGDTGDMVDS
jgi:hypothetical protein